MQRRSKGNLALVYSSFNHLLKSKQLFFKYVVVLFFCLLQVTALVYKTLSLSLSSLAQAWSSFERSWAAAAVALAIMLLPFIQ